MVSCVHHTSLFLVFGTQSGSLYLYYTGDNSPTFIDEHVHKEGGIIRSFIQFQFSRFYFYNFGFIYISYKWLWIFIKEKKS
jgi:hypothetical protein